MRTSFLPVLLALATLAVAPTAQAQSIDEALRLYKARDLSDAAVSFYDVMANDPNPDTRDQAAIYLGETLYKMDLLVPALFYYTYIFKAGHNNRYYLNAIEGLLRLQARMHDQLLVPMLINEGFDPSGFGQLTPDQIAQINYMMGELSFRQNKNQDARAFLEYVPPESKSHPKARYLLGLLEVRAGNHSAALDHFSKILELVPADSDNEELAGVRNLGLIAAGRAAYGLQRYELATKFYKEVPRFSEHWFTAMYENSWSHFLADQPGKALGEAQSVRSPYFERRMAPEAFVVAGTTYFANCQWDRVRREVTGYKREYEPLLAGLTAYLQENREPADYYRDLVAGGNGRLSIQVAREVRRLRRFKDFHFMLSHIEWEGKYIENLGDWKGSRLGDDLLDIIRQTRDDLEPTFGRWARRRLQYVEAVLKDLQSKMNYLDFEVTDAEARWLQQGQEILKTRRKRLPRPEIPNEQWQHWNFDREYWKDELGYIQHSLGSECIEELQ